MLITAMELTMPPFSLAFASTLAVVASSALMRTSLGLRLGVLSLLAQCLYTARGLAVMPVQAPKIYLSLLYAPLFIAWKAGVYLSIALGSATTEWVRTTRNA
jgi:hypothetical protein